MRIPDIYRDAKFGLSIEIFPPKTAEGDASLYENLERLLRFQPSFVSCTYGAGGSTSRRTVEICRNIQTQFGLTATSHFTCVGASVDQLKEWLTFATQAGIGNIMALRGDPPAGETEFKQAVGGLKNANELVTLIRGQFPQMGIGVAGYPEKHPEAPSLEADLANLKRKVDAGADAVYTQLFYSNPNFYRFRDACDKAGIRIPIIPGIMPITEFARIKRITSLCQAHFPQDLSDRLEAVQEDKQAQLEIGVEYAIAQCRDLIAQGVPGLHFYALNKSQACELILDGLNYAPAC
ncbi:MAG: methylenetetrahydrofolate reductase [NAD(P)H] [Planctomycetales bacterium]